MQEVIGLLEKAMTLLDDVEDSRSFEHVLGRIGAKVFLAHASIKYAKAKLHMLMVEKEETCEKS